MRSRFSRMGSATKCCPRSRPRHSGTAASHQVPVLSGATRDEHRLFVGLFRVLAGQPVTAQQYPELLAEAFGDHADQVQASYPLSAYPTPNLAWATVLTDRMWARSTFAQHRLFAQQVPVYAYERPRPAAMAHLRRRPARAARAVPGAWTRWQQTGRLRRRAPARLLVSLPGRTSVKLGLQVSRVANLCLTSRRRQVRP